MKNCRHCGETKLLDAFYRESRGALGRGTYCKDCKRVLKRKWEKANPEKRRIQNRKTRSRPEFRARERARVAAYRAVHGERLRQTRNAQNSEWHRRNAHRMTIANRAGAVVRKALQSGALVRPTVCEQCGRTDRPVDAAHRDYSRPLDVRWLCRSCHVIWDQAEPKTRYERAAEILGVPASDIRPKDEVAA